MNMREKIGCALMLGAVVGAVLGGSLHWPLWPLVPLSVSMAVGVLLVMSGHE